MERPPRRPEQPQPGPIEQAAKTLGVPLEKLRNPNVRTFLGFYCQLERMREQMYTARLYYPQWFTQEEITQEVHNQLDVGIHEEQVVEPRLEPSLAERYTAAEHLVRAALHLMGEGFNGHEVNTEYVRGVGNRALGRYGLRVEYTTPEQPRRGQDHESQMDVPEALRRWAREQHDQEGRP